MNRAIFLLLILSGCSNDAQNKKNFQECVEQAELKYTIAFSEICRHGAFDKPGECSYNIESKNALLRSKDNQISACATMYAPKN